MEDSKPQFQKAEQVGDAVKNALMSLVGDNSTLKQQYDESHKLHVKNNQKINEQAETIAKLSGQFVTFQAKNADDVKNIMAEIVQISQCVVAQAKKDDERFAAMMVLLNKQDEKDDKILKILLEHKEDPSKDTLKKVVQLQTDEIKYLRELAIKYSKIEKKQ